jgi:hypothetical protein
MGIRKMTKPHQSIEARRQTALTEVSADVDRRLAELNAPDAHDRVEAAMELRGRVTPRPKAGESF